MGTTHSQARCQTGMDRRGGRVYPLAQVWAVGVGETAMAMNHEWVIPLDSADPEPSGFPWPYCRVCGVIKRSDGLNKPCKGPTRISLREQDEESE